MPLGTDIAAWLPELRRQAESLHVDTCRIVRLGELGPMDPETGKHARERTWIWKGRCRLQMRDADASESRPGDLAARTQITTVQLPVKGTEGVAIGDIVEMLTCRNDSAVAGRQYTVEALHHKTHASSRRLRVVEGVAA